MAQNFREMLANRRFAIPLIALLGVCFIGLLLLGFVLILPSLRGDGEEVTEEPPTEVIVEVTDTEIPAPPTAEPTETPTTRPSPTMVPVGTTVVSGTEEPTSEATEEATTAPGEGTETVEPGATEEPTPEGGYGDQPTATPTVEDDELAETGVGWGLILFSGLGLALVVIAARRLRLAN